MDAGRNVSMQMDIVNKFTVSKWAGIAQVGIATRYGLDGPGIESRYNNNNNIY